MGTHSVLDDKGNQNLVMGVACLRDGNIYRYDHVRKLCNLSEKILFLRFNSLTENHLE